MASNVKESVVLFLSLNLFLLVSSHDVKYDSNGSPSATNTENPVVIPPGYVLPNRNNTQGKSGTCNPLNLGVCLNLLDLVGVDLGEVPTQPCCSVIEGLVDLEAAVCLCTAVRANVLGININLPISLNVLLNNCGRKVTTEYICGSDNMDSNSNVSSSTTNPINPVDNNSNGSYSTTNPTNPVDNNSNDSSSTNPTNHVDNYSNGSSSTNPTNPVDNNSNDFSSTNPTNHVNNNSNDSSFSSNPTNPVNNYPNDSSSSNPTNPVNNYPNGSSSSTIPTNPIVIHPGYVLPTVSNNQGQHGTCNPLNLGVCVNLLGLVDVELGNVPTKPCCSLIEGLVDLEAAVCLCTAVRANVLDININLPISLNLLFNKCGRRVATEYICSA